MSLIMKPSDHVAGANPGGAQMWSSVVKDIARWENEGGAAQAVAMTPAASMSGIESQCSRWSESNQGSIPGSIVWRRLSDRLSANRAAIDEQTPESLSRSRE